MSDASHVARSLRERLGTTTEDRLGKALSELLENPVLTGAIGRAFDAREKAAQAQEVAMGALNIPSAADIERLTRRLRSVSLRLEGIEDGVERLDRALGPAGSDRSEIAQRLSAIEAQLQRVTERLDHAAAPPREANVATAQTRAGRAKAKTKAKAKAKAKATTNPRAKA
jgi:chromosome segregation ATPase